MPRAVWRLARGALSEQLVEWKARFDAPGFAPTEEGGADRVAAVGCARELLAGLSVVAATELANLPYAQLLEVSRALQEVVAQAVGALWVHGEESLARALTARARQVIPLHAQDDALSAAEDELRLFARLAQARWLLRRNHGRDAVAAAREVLHANHPALRGAAEAILGHGERVERVPRRFEVLGCGAVLYGRDGEQLNGRYRKSLYLALFLVPVLPLARYEVSDIPGGLRFYARVPLSTAQRGWRWLAALALLASRFV